MVGKEGRCIVGREQRDTPDSREDVCGYRGVLWTGREKLG
jgi:tricorn protease-like protein